MASAPLGSVLYTNGRRYFLIPDDLHLAEGTVWMTDVAGNERHVDPETAARFEVDEATADAFIQREVAVVAPQVLDALGPLIQPLARAVVQGRDTDLLSEDARRRLGEQVAALRASWKPGGTPE